MSNIKFYALCCRNMYALKRHQRTIPLEDLVIVINTLDKEFETDAKLYCLSEGIEYYITESDGGPSVGKNSVLDLFEASDYEYMVLIDGDDFITPHGYWTYKQLAQSRNKVDVVALRYQYGIHAETGYNPVVAGLGTPTHRSPLLGSKNTGNPDTVHGGGNRCFLHDHEWWERALLGKLFETNLADPHSLAINDVHTRWATLCYNYIDKWETHLRLVFFSKKAIKNNRFDVRFRIGEDTLFYLALKDQALKGNFEMRHLFDVMPTYVYDTRIDGLVVEEKDKYGEPGTVDFGWYLWLKKLVEEYENYVRMGMMHRTQLDHIQVKTPLRSKVEDKYIVRDDDSFYHIIWPEDYRPDTLGLVNYPNHRPIFY